MENPTEPSGLTARGLTVNSTVAQTRLDEVWRALKREIPDLEARHTAGEVDTEDIADVVYASALRVLRNPEGAKRFGGGVDDYTETVELADASGDIYFTAAELRRLQGVTVVGGFTGSIPYLR